MEVQPTQTHFPTSTSYYRRQLQYSFSMGTLKQFRWTYHLRIFEGTECVLERHMLAWCDMFVWKYGILGLFALSSSSIA
jgi:hypothetical protein